MVTFDAKKLSEAEGSVDGALSLLSGGIKIEVDNTRIQQQADMVEDPETTEEVKKIESEKTQVNEQSLNTYSVHQAVCQSCLTLGCRKRLCFLLVVSYVHL